MVEQTTDAPAIDSVPAFARSAVPPASPRLQSIDALRGFDMLWIIGGDHLVRSLPDVWDSPVARRLADHMEHVPWAGFHFYDLIFPLFVFLVGVVIPFSLPAIIQRQGRPAAVRRVIVRGTLLFLLGVFYMGGIASGLSNVYLAGVLQRIGVAYLFAGLLFCFVRPRGLVVWTIALLITYWALLTFVPVPGIGHPSYDQGRNLAHWIDQRYLPGQKFEGTLLSTLPAVANCLLGIFAGLLLKDPTQTDRQKVTTLFLAGATLLAAGLAWSLQFPIIKLLWTPTYVLVACGISAILLATFHALIELWNLRRWAQPLVWIGANAITLYLVTGVVNFRKLADRLTGGELATALGPWSQTVNAAVALALVVWLAHFLYRRRIFLRL